MAFATRTALRCQDTIVRHRRRAQHRLCGFCYTNSVEMLKYNSQAQTQSTAPSLWLLQHEQRWYTIVRHRRKAQHRPYGFCNTNSVDVCLHKNALCFLNPKDLQAKHQQALPRSTSGTTTHCKEVSITHCKDVFTHWGITTHCKEDSITAKMISLTEVWPLTAKMFPSITAKMFPSLIAKMFAPLTAKMFPHSLQRCFHQSLQRCFHHSLQRCFHHSLQRCFHHSPQRCFQGGGLLQGWQGIWDRLRRKHCSKSDGARRGQEWRDEEGASCLSPYFKLER